MMAAPLPAPAPRPDRKSRRRRRAEARPLRVFAPAPIPPTAEERRGTLYLKLIDVVCDAIDADRDRRNWSADISRRLLAIAADAHPG